MKKHWLGTTALLCAGMVSLIACNGGGSKGEPAKTAKSLSDEVMNPTGMPIVKTPVTLHFTGIQMNTSRPGRWDETDMMKDTAEKSGVKIVWECIPQASWKEKKNLIIASQELPDAFMASMSLTAAEVAQFGADGVLVPLEGLIDSHAPNIKSLMTEFPAYAGATRSHDGHIYALSSWEDLGFDSFSAAIIRKDWLDKVGLPVPSTTEEFYQALKAFKDKDASGTGKTIPFSFMFKESQMLNREVKREFEWVFLSFGVGDNPYHIFIEDNNEVVFTASQPGYKEAVQYLHRLYSEGLIDAEVFTQDRTLLTNKIRQNNVGVYTDYRLEYSMADPKSESLYTLVPPLKGPHGDQRWLRAQIGVSEGAFAVTSACKYPEVAVRWLDFINEEQNNIQMRYGMFKPEDWTASEALIPSKTVTGKWEVNTRPSSIDPSNWPFSSPISVMPVVTPARMIDKYIAEKGSNVAKTKACDFYRPYLTKNPYNYLWRFTNDELEELALLQTDLLGYVDRKMAEWISGEANIEQDWDSYLNELKRRNVDQYLAMYKKAYKP
ncbi:MAG: extracellular solute-binding protein [Spirochaetaceae bacterium]|jgi:putative aldouronate transport system substrate-binding protein|nr:extracellular solute-binding protein [Spirochaetaceae bacterium]